MKENKIVDEIINGIKKIEGIKEKDVYLEEGKPLKYITVNGKDLRTVVKFLKENSYEHLSFVTAIDRLNESNGFDVVYLLTSYTNKNSLLLKTKLEPENTYGSKNKVEILLVSLDLIAEGIKQHESCIGCGLCNKACVQEVDIKAVMIALKKNEAIKAEQISNCTKCGLCEPKCPKKIKITEIFEAIDKIHNKKKSGEDVKDIEAKQKQSDENFVVPSLTEIFSSADWHERETYDMFGIKFDGHKNLKRILLPTQFKGYPLRKSYDINREQEISLEDDFEATKDDITPEKFVKENDGKRYDTQIMQLNVGPHHPSTHGVLRLRMLIDGEKMIKIYPVIGYLHRGVEKICENLNYNHIVPYMDRLDYVAGMLNEFPYVLAMENLMNIQVPERAQVIRVIVAELNRIASHIMWFTTWLMDLGATTPFFYGFREREEILEIFEDLSKARMMFNYMCVGGVKKDIDAGIAKKINKFVDEMPSHIKEYHDLITGNEIFLGRAKGIGKLTKDDAINFGVTGSMLRASGVNYDIRKNEPYSMYDKFKFDVPISNNGDNFARYIVRMKEMDESVKIVNQATQLLNSTKEGEIMAKVPKLITPPKGTVYAKIEHAKGEMGIFIVSDGRSKPYRFKIRSPIFSNLCALPKMCENNYVADVVAIIGTIDPVMGCVDR